MLFAVAKLPNPKLDLAVVVLVKSDKLDAFTNFSPNDVAVVVAKFASSPNAAANSSKVSKAVGAELTNDDTSASTYALIDCCVASLESLLDDILSSSKIAVPLTLVLITGLVSVLFVRVCDPVRVTSPVAFKSILLLASS